MHPNNQASPVEYPDQQGASRQEAALARRLTRVEAQLRAARLWGSLLAIAALSVLVAVWSLSRSGTTQQARVFELVDGEGRSLAQLAQGRSGQPGLYLFDGQGAVRLWLGLDESGRAGLTLAGGEGGVQASMETGDAGPSLRFFNEAGHAGLVAGLGDEGAPSIVLDGGRDGARLVLPQGVKATLEQHWASLNDQGTRAFVEGDLAEAERLYLLAMQVVDAFGEDNLARAATLNNLGALYLRANQTDAADQAYTRSFEIRERLIEGVHPQLAQSMTNMALLRRAQGRAAEAEDLYDRAIEHWEKATDAADPRRTGALLAYGEFLRSLGREDDATRIMARLKAPDPPSP